MERWPTADRALRRRLLGEMRRRHVVERAARTPDERVRRADEISALAAAFRPPLASRTDEPLELWRRLKAKWRAAGAPSDAAPPAPEPERGNER